MSNFKYTIFDTHSHYDDEAFDGDRDEVLKQINEAGVVIKETEKAASINEHFLFRPKSNQMRRVSLR